MQKMICFVLLIASAATSKAQEKGSLKVSVYGMDGKKGVLQAALFDAEDTFLKESFSTQKVRMNGKKTNIMFENLPEGWYAVAVYLDENGNGKLDKNAMGWPEEPYGFSNNAKGSLVGPPSFDKVRLEVSGEGREVQITLK